MRRRLSTRTKGSHAGRALEWLAGRTALEAVCARPMASEETCCDEACGARLRLLAG